MSQVDDRPPKKSEFEQLKDEEQISLVQEFWIFLVEYRNWWLVPILLVFALLGLFIVLGGTGAAPFIYTLF
jgi:hypothetical protein